MKYDRISKKYKIVFLLNLVYYFYLNLEKYSDKSFSIEDKLSVITLETEVVTESSLMVRKSCKL